MYACDMLSGSQLGVVFMKAWRLAAGRSARRLLLRASRASDATARDAVQARRVV